MCPFTHCSQAPDNPEKQTPYGGLYGFPFGQLEPVPHRDESSSGAVGKPGQGAEPGDFDAQSRS